MAPSSLLISGGRVLDPARGIDEHADLLLADGVVRGIVGRDCSGPSGSYERFDGRGLIVSPGFVDIHAHLRQPGQEHKETIATGTRSAAKGGFTTVCCMANTTPVVDNRAQIEYIQAIAATEGVVRVLPLAAVTMGLRGQELTEMADLAEAGAVAFSDDGVPLASARMMRHALEYGRAFDRPIMPHCDDPELMHGASMNEGPVATRLGLRGMPSAGEEALVARDIALADLTGGRLHICHVSTIGAIDAIRRGKVRGIRVTGEASPHHLTLTDEWVAGQRWLGTGRPFDTNTKMNPPLRSEADRRALVEALRDGTLEAIATDHAPHAPVDKDCEFDAAAFGITGFETALGALLRLHESDDLPLELIVERLTAGPARIFGLPYGTLAPGVSGDVCVFEPTARWQPTMEDFVSKGKNSPYLGQPLVGRVRLTVFGGTVVYQT
ncbi:MAG: dihydroorotase [Chloroflexota bacterium]|nr:MAG: dihydroorotase [Chloroflexota bacterium]